ncbi:MAG: MATE family efflux transporter, partial [Clostridia bacterium]|nr:MATE family efflux transporter [Clostridia bacterium]
SGIMRGAGDTMPSMWISMFTTVVIRVPLAYLWAWLTRSQTYPAGSPDALFFALLISWVLGAVATYLWYRRGAWQDKSLIPSSEPLTA